MYPYSVSSYTNDIYGLVIMMVFFVLLTVGFIFELGKNALSIDSRQTYSYNNEDTVTPHIFISKDNPPLNSSFISVFTLAISRARKISLLPLEREKKNFKNKGLFSTHSCKLNKENTFYIPLYDNEQLILVPVVSTDTITFEPDLTKPIQKFNPIPNNETDSRKAIEKAITIFKNSDLCVCDLKQVS